MQANQVKIIFEFIQKATMEALPTYEKQFQGQLDIGMTEMEM